MSSIAAANITWLLPNPHIRSALVVVRVVLLGTLGEPAGQRVGEAARGRGVAAGSLETLERSRGTLVGVVAQRLDETSAEREARDDRRRRVGPHQVDHHRGEHVRN